MRSTSSATRACFAGASLSRPTSSGSASWTKPVPNDWIGRVQYDVRDPSADDTWRESLAEETHLAITNDYQAHGAIVTESALATISFGFEGRCALDEEQQLGCRIDSGLLGFDPLVVRGAFEPDSGRVHFERLSFGNERWLRVR